MFEDVVSIKIFDGPGLTGMPDNIRPVDTFAAVRRDRLGRSLRELIDGLETQKNHEIALLSIEETIGISSAAGELVCHLFGSIAQRERLLIAKGTRDGRRVAREPASGHPPPDPEKLEPAMLPIKSGMPRTKAARQIGPGHLGSIVRFKRIPMTGCCND